MTTITTRSGKGSPLTNDEVDANFTGLNTDKVETSGDSMTGDLSFGDNNKVIFGAGSDLSVYHDGSNSFIDENGVGNLFIRSVNGASARIYSGGTASSNLRLLANSGGEITLYHSGSARLATSSTGIDVTGSVTADTLDIDNLKILSGQSTTPTNLASPLIYKTTSHSDYGNGDLIIQARSSASRAIYMLTGTTTPVNRLRVGGNGDISFYDSSGTTAKLEWDASDEDLKFADNSKAVFGAGSDLQIYHDGNNSRVEDTGTGGLRLIGSTFVAMQSSSGEDLIKGVENGAATLYYNNAEKLATSSTGIDVTGSVTADGLTVDGTGDLGTIGNGAFNAAAALGFQSDRAFFGYSSSQNALIQSGASKGVAIEVNSDTLDSGTRAALFASNGDVSFYNSAGSSQDLFWDASTSRLGLGTTSPDYLLNLEGSEATILIDNTTGSPDQPLLIFQADMGTNDRNFQIKSPATDSASAPFRFVTGNSFAFEIDSNDSALVIDSSANVGIGTSSPIHRLSVDSSNRLWNVNDNGASNYVTTSATNTSGSVVFHRQVADRFHFGRAIDGTDDKVVIDSSGNVGINLTNPAQELDVNGSIALAGKEIARRSGNNIILGDVDAAGGGGNLTLRTGGGDKVSIATTGAIDMTGDSIDGTVAAAYYIRNRVNGGSLNLGVETTAGSLYYPVVINGTSDVIIFKNAEGEMARFDTSGNLLVGATSSATTSYGAKVLKDNSASEIFAVHRQASDGSLIEFARGGTAVGNIQSRAGVVTTIVLNPASGNGAGLSGGTKAIVPADEAGIVDNDISLGVSSHRFKDLYLSNTLTLSNATTSSFLQVSSNILQFGTSSADPVVFYVNSSEKARLDSSGNLLVGTTNLNPHQSNTAADAGTVINANGIVKMGRNQNPSLLVNRMGNDGLLAQWLSRGSFVGNISVTSTTTTYNSASDVRLKDNIVDAPSASDDIDAIQVRSFDWKADGSHQKYGMVAQELQSVAPDAVSEGDTEEDMMGVDYSKLVPMLVKEIQSLRARVAQLEND